VLSTVPPTHEVSRLHGDLDEKARGRGLRPALGERLASSAAEKRA
jgi:hypothetical protein